MHVLKKSLFITGLLLLSLSVMAESYSLGQGYDVGLWNIGGYATVKFKAPIQQQQAAEIEIDDIALFVRGHLHQYLNPFFEIEYSGQPIWIEGDGAFSKSGQFVVERLYNELRLSDRLIARIGKMLAPVGEWNQIHADPLVATVNRPLATYLNFSEFISGVYLQYQTQSEWLPNVKVYYQPWTELLPKSLNLRPVRYKNISGLNLQYGDEFSGRIALSIQHAKLTTRNEQQTLFALDGGYDFDTIKLSAHLFYIDIAGQETTRVRDHEWGGYLQGVIPLSEQWSLVARGEYFRSREIREAHYNGVFGINFRPHSAIVWKLEYLLSEGADVGAAEGVYGSFGVMF